VDVDSQGLAWSRRAPIKKADLQKYLQRLADRMEEGSRRHPRNDDLRKPKHDVKQELLGTAVA